MPDKEFLKRKITLYKDDFKAEDLWSTIIKEEDALAEQEKRLKRLLSEDGFLSVFHLRKGFTFEGFCREFDKLPQKYSVEYIIRCDAAVIVKAKTFTFAYTKYQKHFKMVIKRDIAELLGIENGTIEFDGPERCNLHIRKLLDYDDEILRCVEHYKELKEWRKHPLYTVYLKKFRDLAEEIERERELVDNWYSYQFVISVSANNGIEICYLSLEYKNCTLAHCVRDLRKLFAQLREKLRDQHKRLQEGCREWIDRIRSYKYADGNDMSTGYHSKNYPNDVYTEFVLSSVLPKEYTNPYARLIWRHVYDYYSNNSNYSAERILKKIIQLKDKEITARIEDNASGRGKTIHITMPHLTASYDDEQRTVNIVPCEEIQSMTSDAAPRTVCATEKDGPLNVYAILNLNRDIKEYIEDYKIVESRTAKPIHQRIVECVAYMLNTAYPLVKIREHDEEYGKYAEYLNIWIDDSDNIKISLGFGLYCDWIDYETQKMFEPTEDFEKQFLAWWYQSMLMHLKWMKSQLAEQY